MADNTDLLAMMGDFMRQSDRQHADHMARMDNQDRVIASLLESLSHQFEKMDQRFEKMDQRFERMEDRLEKIDSRLERVEERLDATVTHLAHLTEKVDSIDGRLGRVEQAQPAYQEVVRRLMVLENIVLRQAS